MQNDKIKNYSVYLIIFFGFFYSCFVGLKYIEKYDVYEVKAGQVSNPYFFAKEGGTPNYWFEASDIKDDLKKKNYFETGNKYEFKYLPPRVVYLYYELINENIKFFYKSTNQYVLKKDNKKSGLIVLQIILYFLSILFLYKKLINKIFENNYLLILPTFIFLSFEPTLNQWVRAPYSEAIFFCLQILLLINIINYSNQESFKKIMIISIILSLMYLQRSVSIYYFFIIIFYFYFFYKQKLLVNISIIILIYLGTHLFIGFHNFKRDGKFYFLPLLAKEDMYGYFIPKLIKYTKDNNFETRHDKLNNFVKLNKLNHEKEINIKDRIKIANSNFFESFELIKKYPFKSIKEYSISLSHFFLLKPNEMHFLFENNIKYDGKYYLSENFKKELPFKIIYSLIIYSISLLGLLYFIKRKNFKIIFILISSIIYFSLPVVWHKQSSYLSPVLIYLSILFGAGFTFLKKEFKQMKI
jgi:hypothetical protein|tara:strand:+ start:113 stop:1519 length:1407 start_codon:yes stop_codon:yes gene_type:complete